MFFLYFVGRKKKGDANLPNDLLARHRTGGEGKCLLTMLLDDSSLRVFLQPSVPANTVISVTQKKHRTERTLFFRNLLCLCVCMGKKLSVINYNVAKCTLFYDDSVIEDGRVATVPETDVSMNTM